MVFVPYPACISCPSLCNKSPQNIVAPNNKHWLPHDFEAEESGGSLAVSLTQSLALSRGYLYTRFKQERIFFHAYHVADLTFPRAVGQRHQSFPHGLYVGKLTTGERASLRGKKKPNTEAAIFLCPNLRSEPSLLPYCL